MKRYDIGMNGDDMLTEEADDGEWVRAEDFLAERAERDGWEENEHAQYLGRLEAERNKDAAYVERNRLVALLARIYPSQLFRTDIPGWDPEWHNCVFVVLPTGQASWHYHDRERYMFEGLPVAVSNPWDGHSTEEKHHRIEALTAIIKPRISTEQHQALDRSCTRCMAGEAWHTHAYQPRTIEQAAPLGYRYGADGVRYPAET